MNTTQLIALDMLDADPKNVRKTYRREGIEELAASLLANGQLQNLVVRKAKKGRFFVTAGGRRLAALNLLAEQGHIGKNHMVECKEREAEDATEISLAENVMREAMNRADEFEAYLAMAEAGKTVPQIAERFGTSELIVNRRLALAKVSPTIFALYREEEMTFEQLQAFTITDDHARQVEVWESLPNYDRHAVTIRRLLAKEEVHARDKRVKFLGGLDAYEAAGGAVRRDLFDDQGGGYATDSGFLDSQVLAALEKLAEPVRAEGWKWVEVYAERPTSMFDCGRVYPEKQELPEADQTRLDQLTSEYNDLSDMIEAGDADEEAEARIDQLEQEMHALGSGLEAFTPEAFEQAGAMIYLDYYGKVEIARGLVRSEDETDEDQTEAEAEEAKEAGPAAITLKHSATLIEDLTAQKTAALRVELANNHDIALAAVVHALLLSSIYRYGSGLSALQLSLTYEGHEGSMKKPEDCKPALAFAELKEKWGDHLPGNPADLWEWCLDQPRDQLLALLAFAAAHSINAMEPKFHGRDKAIAHANEVGRALNVDMRDWFETSGDSYFQHLNRNSIQAAVAEVRGADFADGFAAMKKPDAVSQACKAVKGTGWLPLPLRIVPRLDDDTSDDLHQFPLAAE